MRIWVFAALVSLVLLSCQTQKVYAGWGPCPTHDWLTGTPYGLPGTGFDADEFLDEGQEESKQETRQSQKLAKQKEQSQTTRESQPNNVNKHQIQEEQNDYVFDNEEMGPSANVEVRIDDIDEQENSGSKDLKTILIIFLIGCGIFMFVMSTTSETGPRR